MSEETAKKQLQDEVSRDQLASRAPPRGAPVKFDNNIDIFPDSRLPDYDVGDIKAYRAVSRDKSIGTLFALVCERQLVPRINVASNYAAISNAWLVPLVAKGIIFWPPTNQQHYVFIYRDVLGKRLLAPGQPQALGWRQDEVLNVVIKPMISVLMDLMNRDFAHGNIHPGNMFTEGNTHNDKVSLGQCLAAPSSCNQPALYQTIERGICGPTARGEASPADDIYAFGVTIAVFLRSGDPMQGMSDEEIVRMKVEQSSYSAITGSERFKGSILELLRGVLHDDASQRWTMEEITAWLDGRRLSPKQSIKEKKASRPIVFATERYYQKALLAMSLTSNSEETMRIVESGELDQWITRSLEDDFTLERVENATKTAREKGTSGYEDRLASTLSVALNSKSPIFFKDMRMTGDGVGKALAEAFVLKRDVSPYVDLFAQNIAFNWITMQETNALDGSLISRFDNCRNFIRHGKFGFGIERCVYTLCPEVHCLSDKLKGYFVTTPENLVLAFEDLCRKGQAPGAFFDRHSAAFLSVKDSKLIDVFMFDLGSNEDYKKILGNLKCLATIQTRCSLPPLPGIAKAFMEVIDVVCARYHDRDVREKLAKNIARFAADGDLVKMAGLLSNTELMARDMAGFREAMHEYASLTREHNTLAVNLADQVNFGKSTGHEIAALVSSVIAALVILVVALMYFHKGPSY